MMSEYERNLRQLALLGGLSNSDMGRYFQEMLNSAEANGRDANFFQKRLKRYEDDKQKMIKKPPFHYFYLNDLIGLLDQRDVITLQFEVVELRNAIMHADEMVRKVNVSAPDYIFDFESFENFFYLVQTFLHDAARVRNRIAFLDGLEEMGRPP